LAALVCCFSKLSQLEPRAVAQERATTDGSREAPLAANGPAAALGNVAGVAAHAATSGAPPASAPVVDALPASTTPKPSAPAPIARARPKTSPKGRPFSASNSCNPPYRIDSEGIKRMKRECL
jgi:hypothetical protein